MRSSAFLAALSLCGFASAVPTLRVRANNGTQTNGTDGSQSPPPRPYTPVGGLGTNSTPPKYVALSDFDFQSFNLALNQEYIELDLFHYGLARFSDQEFDEAGINAEGRFLIQYMADQEVGHATVIQNILQGRGARPCTYRYNFNTVREFIDFCQKLTRWGEAGVYGFLEHLNARDSATLLLDSITVEARQQMAFRQLEGLFPMPEWHETGITQSMAWTLLAPYIESCPAENPRIEWQNFPGLIINNPPDAVTLTNSTEVGQDNSPAITRNRSEPLSAPGRNLTLTWELPGQTVGYNDSYTTNTTAGAPRFVAWISQLNTTYTPLENIQNNTGTTIQLGGEIWGENTAPIVNNTVFVLITDDNPYVTPFNLTELNQHVVAGPAVYTAG